MRTTLTLDDDLAKQLQERARRGGESFKQVVNETLRRGLRPEKAIPRLPRFEVKAKACGFQRGVDLLHLNQLSDDLEIEDFRGESVGGADKR
jgi:plasmid stability protein